MQIKYDPMLKLKLKRVEKGLTQKELGEKVGISQNSLSMYEAGLHFPRRNVLDKLAEFFDCEISELI